MVAEAAPAVAVAALVQPVLLRYRITVDHVTLRPKPLFFSSLLRFHSVCAISAEIKPLGTCTHSRGRKHRHSTTPVRLMITLLALILPCVRLVAPTFQTEECRDELEAVRSAYPNSDLAPRIEAALLSKRGQSTMEVRL